jgi:hypothetical protein
LKALDPYIFYWKNYGGVLALLKSLYFYLSIILTSACYPFWSREGVRSADLALDIIPSLMGFSLGGMAIVIAISNGTFMSAIKENGAETSLFIKINLLFFHFILVQAFALISAIVVLSFPKPIWISGFAFFFFSYGLFSSLSIAAALLNAAKIYNAVKD